MCFLVKKGAKEKIAKKDITCYKIITEDNRAWFERGFKYKPGENNPEVPLIAEAEGTLIYEGYHSYKYYLIAWYNLKFSGLYSVSSDDPKPKLVKMVIPTGSKYYKNLTEFVSSCIHWKKS